MLNLTFVEGEAVMFEISGEKYVALDYIWLMHVTALSTSSATTSIRILTRTAQTRNSLARTTIRRLETRS